MIYVFFFNTILNKSAVNYLVTIDKVILKFTWRSKRYRIANSILKEKNKVRGLKQSDFKTYYENTVINTVWDCGKNR